MIEMWWWEVAIGGVGMPTEGQNEVSTALLLWQMHYVFIDGTNY